MKKIIAHSLTLLWLLLLLHMVAVAQTRKPTTPKPAAKPPAEKGKETVPPKVPQLLEASGHNYSKAGENVWLIPFEGNSQKQFNVIVVYVKDMLVVFTMLAEKKNIKTSAELWQKLLELNNDFDRVKILLDEDGDLSMRSESSLRLIDVEDFKDLVEQIAAAADQVHAAIKQHLIAEKPEK